MSVRNFFVISLLGFWFASFSRQSCLEDLQEQPPKRKRFQITNATSTLTISTGKRTSHQFMAQLLMILLEEGLGYENVALVETDQVSPVFLHDIRDKEKAPCRQNSLPGCLPAVLIYPEVWVPFDSRLESGDSSSWLSDAGSLGFTGRQGWYTSSSLVTSEWNSRQWQLDNWRSLTQLGALKIFHNTSSVEQLNDTCYGCIHSVFYPERCNSTKGQMSGNCAVAIATYEGILSAGEADGGLVKLYKNNHSRRLMTQIEKLGLNVSIAWVRGNTLRNATAGISKQGPILFNAWYPDALTSSAAFSRISFPYCSAVLQQAGETYEGCDSPVYEAYKFIWKPLLSTHSDIYKLLSNVFISNNVMIEILRGIDHTNATTKQAVCRWLRKSKETLTSWLSSATPEKTTIYIGGLFPSREEPQAIWFSPGVETGARMAVERINTDPRILEKHELILLVQPTQCRRELVMNAYITYLDQPNKKMIGVIGPACSRATMPLAEVSKFRNTILMGYGASEVSFSDRERFPYYFRTVPTVSEFKRAYVHLFRLFGWRHCATLAESKYPQGTFSSRAEYFFTHGIDIVSSRVMPSDVPLNAAGYVKSLKESKVMVVLLYAYPEFTREVLCEAYKQGLHPNYGYTWFLLGWFDQEWWDTDWFNNRSRTSPESVPCTSSEMKELVDQGYFSLSSTYFGEDSQAVVGGGTVEDWKMDYKKRLVNESNKKWSDYATFAFDAVWAYALAVDKLLMNDSHALDSIDQETTALLFRSFIQGLDFLGVSGRVQFNSGDRVSSVTIRQNFAKSRVVIGRFIPDSETNGNELGGRLHLNESLIRWATGEVPRDITAEVAKAVCAVELIRSSLGVSCAVAGGITAVIVLTCVVAVLLCVSFLLKGRYSSKYKKTKARLRELGLLDSNYGSIFQLDAWEVPREAIILNRKLGEGAFGAVFGGEALGFTDQEGSISVAVKTLKVGASTEDKVEFLSEADQMKQLNHDNIIQLLAVCTIGEPVYIIMELMIHGNLKSFLLARRRFAAQQDSPEAQDVTPRKLTTMALDIAQGLQYLTTMKIVHRDLALRNCMVGTDYVVKIGDFGLARSLQASNYYRFERKGMLPVRWMAPECMNDGVFTRHTDIWSYGVALWELATFGGFPYQGMSNEHVMEQVLSRHTMDPPRQATAEMVSLLKQCWRWTPTDRPNPEEIIQILTGHPEMICACVEVPSTTVNDASVCKFDNRKPPAHARLLERTLSSQPSFFSSRVQNVNITPKSTPKTTPKLVYKQKKRFASFKKPNEEKVLQRKSTVHF